MRLSSPKFPLYQSSLYIKYELEFNKIPENILNYLKLLFLDGVGCCIHGNTLEWTKTLEEVVTNKENINQCSIIGTNKKTTLLNAVLINSTAG